MEENIFINTIWPQKQGEFIKILNERKRIKGRLYYECEFIKYPYKNYYPKGNIVRGTIINPQIEQVEFIEKIWPQNCGDSLKIIKKSSLQEKKGGEYLWECEFQKYPCKVYARKYHILRGEVINKKIENFVFIDKEWPQVCGDIIKVIEKTNKTLYTTSKNILYRCQFLKYPCEVFALKDAILKGYVPNPKIDKKDLYIKEIKNNFNYKPNIVELVKFWNISESGVIKRLKQYDLFSYINYKFYTYNHLEEDIKKYIVTLDNSLICFSDCKELDGKEIDIYIPSKKIGFEINGIYWHSQEYKDKYYHLNKLKLANSKGIKLYFIWEDEWKNNKEEIKRWIKEIIFQENSILFKNEVDKVGFLDEKTKISSPVLINRGKFNCYNCGYLI